MAKYLSDVRKNAQFRFGLLAIALGELLFGFAHLTSRSGHFATGLLFGLGITLVLGSLYRSRSTTA